MITEYSFGAWLRRRRKALRLTRVALAATIGCAEVTLAKIERDERRPSQHLAECLADVLIGTMPERHIFLRAARREVAVDRLAVPTAHIQELLNVAHAASDPTMLQILLAALQRGGLMVIEHPQRTMVLDLLGINLPDTSIVAVIYVVQG